MNNKKIAYASVPGTIKIEKVLASRSLFVEHGKYKANINEIKKMECDLFRRTVCAGELKTTREEP